MAKRTTPLTARDDQVRALLEHYHCPVPFHAVRTRFLGNIASPDMQGSPMKMVEALWGGELPTFDSIDEALQLLATQPGECGHPLARGRNLHARQPEGDGAFLMAREPVP